MTLPFKLLGELCSVIQDTGFVGSAEEYIQQFYNKSFEQLNVCEAEMIIMRLKEETGKLFNTKEGNYDIAPKTDPRETKE